MRNTRLLQLAWCVMVAGSAARTAAASDSSGPTPEEQYFVQLVNRARMAPADEARRIGIDLNEGLRPGTIEPRPKQPLAINQRLVEAAREHTQWMLKNGQVAHEGKGGSEPMDRMKAAGYRFDPPAGAAENLGFKGTTGEHESPTEAVAGLYKGLFVDEGVPGRGHRTNLFKEEMRETGVGVVKGVVSMQGNDFNSWLVTQNLAYAVGDSFLTGVVFEDRVKPDRFYTPGEGRGGVTITATREGDAKEFSATTWESGGYTLRLPSGTYRVRATGRGINRDSEQKTVRIDRQNVAMDIVVGQ